MSFSIWEGGCARDDLNQVSLLFNPRASVAVRRVVGFTVDVPKVVNLHPQNAVCHR
jgi:hypothetical protein